MCQGTENDGKLCCLRIDQCGSVDTLMRVENGEVGLAEGSNSRKVHTSAGEGKKDPVETLMIMLKRTGEIDHLKE